MKNYLILNAFESNLGCLMIFDFLPLRQEFAHPGYFYG